MHATWREQPSLKFHNNTGSYQLSDIYEYIPQPYHWLWADTVLCLWKGLSSQNIKKLDFQNKCFSTIIKQKKPESHDCFQQF